MKPPVLIGLAALAFVAVVFVPELLSFGATGHLDSASALAEGHLVQAGAIAFGGGLLTALTPCVFPLIPITVAIFSGQGGPRGAAGQAKPQSRARSAALTLSYVHGMAAMFVGLGITAALAGKAFGSALSTPPVSLLLAVFFALLAFSMFGFFELALPSGLALRLNRVGGAGFAGAFSMGLVAGLVAAPCTGPVLLGILTYVASHQSIAMGGILLYLYALGVGVPFILVGVFSYSLGKSGPWMDSVKSVVGIVLLAMGIGYLRRAFPFALHLPPGSVVVYGLAGLAALGVLIGAIHRSFHGSHGEKLLKAAGLVLVIFGVTARLDVESVALAESPGGLVWETNLDRGLAAAHAAHRPALVDFGADWCAACKELERKTYPDARVRAEARRFVTVKVDGTKSSDALDKIYDRYGIEGLPTVLFFSSDGTLVKDLRVTGFVTPEELLPMLKKVQ